jgi:serine/threonine-protein kinase
MTKDTDPDAQPAALAATARYQADPAPSMEAPLTLEGATVPTIDGEDRYTAGSVLGQGGMGFVRLDRDRRIGRQVARKFLKNSDDAQSTRRFLREARIQGQLEHPAIAPVYDVARASSGELFFTMKRLKGVTIEQILTLLAAGDAKTRDQFPRRRLLSALLTVCDALEYAHARGVVHRDLKPANVMLGDYGEVWVLDWGIARLVDEPKDVTERHKVIDTTNVSPEVSRGRLTSPGEVIGTLHYISPEQVKDEPLDGRADVFALGMMLFEILTLRPYRANEGWLRLLAHLSEGQPARPSSLVSGVEPELDAICVRATQPRRDDRFASAREMRSAIDAFLAGERDADARRASATRVIETAKAELAQRERDTRADATTTSTARADAMHEALRALSLDPDHAEAQRFVQSLVESVTIDPPPGAQEEAVRARSRIRHEGMRTALWGLFSWLIPVPLIVVSGVRDWTMFGLGLALMFAGIALAADRLARGESRRYDGVVLATIIGCVVVLVSGYLGPFVVVPACGNAAAMLFAMHATRNERIATSAILCTAALLPFLIDASGLVPPGFEFVGDTIVLHPRLVDIPRIPTTLGLVWVSASFTILSAFIVGRMRDRLDDAERRLHLSVWHLRQLFPAAATASDAE